MADTTEAEVHQELEGGADAVDEEAELEKLQAELYGDGGEEDGNDEPGSGTGQDGAVGEEGVPAAPMSKSQMKKKARMERMLAKRQATRQREKEVRAARREEAVQRKAAELASMTDEQKAALRKETKARFQAQKDQEKQLKQRMQDSLLTGPRVVIDLDWDDKMNESEVRHLAQQLSFSYAANKAVERPAHLVLSSLNGRVAETATKMVSGMDKWHATRSEQHYTQLFGSPEDKARLVYLTADSPKELDALDEDKIYVIGGLVDHNRYKGLCEERARAAGVATARLPISRHVQLASRAVLTVNQVFQMLVEYYNCRDWAAVLDKVLPPRKRADSSAAPQQKAQRWQQAQQAGRQQGQQQQQREAQQEQTAGAGTQQKEEKQEPSAEQQAQQEEKQAQEESKEQQEQGQGKTAQEDVGAGAPEGKEAANVKTEETKEAEAKGGDAMECDRPAGTAECEGTTGSGAAGAGVTPEAAGAGEEGAEVSGKGVKRKAESEANAA